MADIRAGLRHNFHVLGIACILVLSGTGLGVNAFADNHTVTITLQDLGVLQLVAHDLFDVRRGDNMTPESAVDFENGRLDLSTLLVNTTSGNYFDAATIAKGGEVRNRENVVMFTVASDLGVTYLDFLSNGTREDARNKTLTLYHEMFAAAYSNAFGELIPDKRRGQATPDGNIALRTVHDFLPGNITVNGTVTPLLSIPPNATLSDSDMMQLSSPLDGKLDAEFLAIMISHPDGPVITVDLLDADRTFGKQFSTKFSFDELLAQLRDGEYDTNDKALVEIRNLISVVYPEVYQETASRISVSSTNVHGLYVAGDIINITAMFPEAVTVGMPEMDGTLPFIELDTTPPAHAVYKDSTDQTMTFEYVVRNGDYSPDLEYDGTDAFQLNTYTLQYPNGTDFPTNLPQPGHIGSLSYDKNIRIGLAPPIIKHNAAPSVVSLETGELDTIIMTMSEDVRNSRETAGFTISGISPAPSIDSITLSGRIITLGLSANMSDSDSPRLAYNSTEGGMTDLDVPPKPLASFDRAVRNTLDTTAPTVRSVTIDNSGSVYVRLSESVQQGSAGQGDFRTNNTSIQVSKVAVSGSTVTLELFGEIPDGTALTLSYAGGPKKIADKAGNLLGSFDEPINKQSRKRAAVKSMPAVDLASMKSLGYLNSFNGTATPHDPFAPITPMNAGDASDFTIAINGMHYMLGGSLNTLEPQTLLAGVNNAISVAVHDRADIAHFTLYMNLHGQDTDYKDSDTYVTYDMGNIRIADPHDLISNATASIKTSGADLLRHIVVFAITFEGEMEQTNLVAKTWNTGASFTIVRILNAFAVSAALPDAQPALSVDPMPVDPMPVDPMPVDPMPVDPMPVDPMPVDPMPVDPMPVDPMPVDPMPVDPMPDAMGEPEDAEPAAATPDQNTVEMVIRAWSGFEPESVTDAQLLAVLNLDYPGADIPGWVMTELGVLAARGDVTVGEFKTALEYVLEHVLEHS